MACGSPRFWIGVSLLIGLTFSADAAERRDRRDEDRSRDERREPGTAPVFTREGADFAMSEDGCLSGRIQDYLRRHGDNGVIDPFVMLELSRDMQRTLDEENRHKRALSISGTVWNSIGPTNGGGRATAIAAHPSVANTLIIGAAGGGAWKTTDGGANWAALTETIPNLSVGAIALAPSAPLRVYLGTGEGGYSGDFIPGIGLLMTIDGGTNWTLPASVIATMFYKISVHPTSPLELVVATNAGAKRSTAGQDGPWTTVIAHDSSVSATGYGDVTDLVRDPSNPLILYAATWDTGYWCARYACGHPTNFAGSTVLKSVDGGVTWNPAATGLPVTTATQNVSRIALAIAPSSPTTLYAATSLFDLAGNSVSHIYKTTNGGALWTDTALSGYVDRRISHYHNGAGDQVSYDNTIVVKPTDANTVVAGGVYYVRTIDGGTTWSRGFQSPASVHVDVHELRYDAGGTLFVACDGGMYSSTDDAGTNSTDRNTTLVTRQYYTLATDPANRNRAFGGMQDNGSNRRPDAGGTAWDFMTGGDGFGCALIPTAPSIVLTSSQYSNIYRTTGGGAGSPLFFDRSPLFPAGESTPFGTSITNDPMTPRVLYTGTSRLWKSTTGGESWVPLPTTVTDASTWDTTRSIGSIAIARSNPSILMISKGYDATNSYRPAIFRSTDGGNTWAMTNGGLPTFRYPTSVEIDPANPSVAYVTLSGVSGSSVYKTINGGTSWSASATGLPPFSAQIIRVDPTDSTTVYCGTDVGVYRSTDSGATWTRFGTGMPAVSVYDLRALNDGSILRAVTHGRGAWELQVTGVTNNPPTAAISTPATATVTTAKGSTVSFTGSVGDPDGGDSATPLWTFPDTWATSTTTSTSHTFSRAGTFPVTLLATDTHGATTAATVNVNVTDSGDDCIAPLTIPASGPFPWSASLTTESSVVQTSDPGAGGATPAPSCYPYLPRGSLWLSFTPASTGTYDFYTCGSTVATLVQVWTGAACGPYTLVPSACFVNTFPIADCATDSKLSVSLTSGTPYRIFVSGYYSNYQGPITLTIAQGAIGTGVSNVSPSSGPTTGGTSIAIAGSAFANPATVSVGGVAATGVTVVSPSLITAITPAHAAGVADVSVTSAATTATLGSSFTYLAAVVLTAPTNLVAGATGATQTTLNWTAVAQADHYEVFRTSNIATPYSIVGYPSGATFIDNGLSANTAYLYKVRAIGPAGETSSYSNVDLATTILFTNDPLQAGITPVRGVHFVEARTAVNAVRTLGALGPFVFADGSLPGILVQANHLLQLRTALNEARTKLSLTPATYTYTITAFATPIRAVDLGEIRAGVK